MKPAYSGLVVIDVDGVIYRDIFLRRIVQSKGLLSSLRILSLGVDYYLNRIPLDTLLADGYRLADAFEVRKAQKIAGRIKKVANIKYTVDVLHDRGYFVSLISAGIPDLILTNLAVEIGADHSRGMNIEIKDGNFEVGAIRIISKVETVEQLLGEIGLSWNEVVSIGDDPNNIELLKRSGLGIGWNPVRSVREHSDVVIEGTDLSEILPYILPEESLPKGIRKERYFWKRELFRKGIHLLGCFFPFIARSNKTFAVFLLGAVMFLYICSELLRSRGIPYPAVSRLTRMARRHTEHGGIITGPLLLGAGILITILFFEFPVYLPAILTVAVSDALSALVGRRFGTVHIFKLRNRTLEGSLAFFFSALGIMLSTTPVRVALPATALATFLEMVSVYNLDNLLIPVGTAVFLKLMGGALF